MAVRLHIAQERRFNILQKWTEATQARDAFETEMLAILLVITKAHQLDLKVLSDALIGVKALLNLDDPETCWFVHCNVYHLNLWASEVWHQ